MWLDREARDRAGDPLVECRRAREHARWALAAAAAGKHVLCDKSLTLSRADAEAVRAAFRARGLRIVEGFKPVRALATATLVPSGVDGSTDALLGFPSGAVASVHGSLISPFEQGLVVSGDRGRIVLQRPFIPRWDETDVIIETTDGNEVHRVPGANHFLHMIEHVEACFLDPSRPLTPAEDGVDNIAACALVQAAADQPMLAPR